MFNCSNLLVVILYVFPIALIILYYLGFFDISIHSDKCQVSNAG